MFYIKNCNDTHGIVVDTDDCSEEIYLNTEILEMSEKVKIYGVSNGTVSIFSLQSYVDMVMARDKLNDIRSEYKVIDNPDDICALSSIHLKELRLPYGMTYRVADGVDTIDLAEGVVTGKSDVRLECEGDFRIVLPKSCTSIMHHSFYRANITSINLERVKIIGESTFFMCSKLCCVDLSSIKMLGERAFANCTSLSSVTLNEGGDYKPHSFANTPKLTLPQQFNHLKEMTPRNKPKRRGDM